MKDVEPKNTTQTLTQTQTHQKVIQDMSELQKQFEEATKAKEEIITKTEQAETLKKQLKVRAEKE